MCHRPTCLSLSWKSRQYGGATATLSGSERSWRGKVRWGLIICSSIRPMPQLIQDYSLTKCNVPKFCFTKQLIDFAVWIFSSHAAGGGPTPPWKSSDPAATLSRRRRDIWWWVHRGAAKGLGTVSQQVRFFCFPRTPNSQIYESFCNFWVVNLHIVYF